MVAAGQSCVTQSQMQPAVRDVLVAASLKLGQAVQAGDQSSLKATTIPEFAKDFSGVADVVTSTAPHLKDDRAAVEQVYILDASAATAPAETQFFCNLNHTQLEADFTIPQLPPGKYGFAMVRFEGGAAPWRVSLLLREESAGGRWLLAGLYPKELTAGGHDGLWFWTDARAELAKKHPWVAWLELEEAQSLLQPAAFVSSTHLEKLQTELTADAPPPVKAGLSATAPLVVKGADGAEYHFTAITPDDSLGQDKIDVAAHLKLDGLGEPGAARKRNSDAMAALVAAYPELRQAFHGVWIFAEAPNLAPYATESAMAEIR